MIEETEDRGKKTRRNGKGGKKKQKTKDTDEER